MFALRKSLVQAVGNVGIKTFGIKTMLSNSASKNVIDVMFVETNKIKNLPAKGVENENLLDVLVNNKLEPEFPGFGACEGTLTCSTCHVYFAQEDFEKIKAKPTDEELDMIELAFEPCETSRLACQVRKN